MKKIFMLNMLFFLVFFGFGSRVEADVCSIEDTARFKTLANYIEVTYDYIETTGSYSVTITGIPSELFVLNTSDYSEYKEADAIDGNVVFETSEEEITLKVYALNCESSALRTISLDFPEFNVYSESSECKELEEYNIDVCDPWYQGEIDYNLFYERIAEALPEEEVGFLDQILLFLNHTYVWIGGGILLVGILIVIIVIRRRRSVLE